eukprot:scaffold748_cov329-Pavlova_lutheri.AAC.28
MSFQDPDLAAEILDEIREFLLVRFPWNYSTMRLDRPGACGKVHRVEGAENPPLGAVSAAKDVPACGGKYLPGGPGGGAPGGGGPGGGGLAAGGGPGGGCGFHPGGGVRFCTTDASCLAARFSCPVVRIVSACIPRIPGGMDPSATLPLVFPRCIRCILSTGGVRSSVDLMPLRRPTNVSAAPSTCVSRIAPSFVSRFLACVSPPSATTSLFHVPTAALSSTSAIQDLPCDVSSVPSPFRDPPGGFSKPCG